jgi:hypothetical protein
MRFEKILVVEILCFKFCSHLALSLPQLKLNFFAGKILITHGGSVLNSSQKVFEYTIITELDV